MTEYKLLGEFVTHCKRCAIDLNHRITLMNGDVPKRVLCLTCQWEHAYRAPSAAKKTSSTRMLSTHEMARVRQGHEEESWKTKLGDKSKTPHPYSASVEYGLDDHVYHPTFGLGLVVGFSEPEKVQIYFDGDVKLLKGKKIPVVTEKKALKFG
jgi:hypothetical protein